VIIVTLVERFYPVLAVEMNPQITQIYKSQEQRAQSELNLPNLCNLRILLLALARFARTAWCG
jgi:hypothetical protein